jgi:salicylate hydroxylase
MLAPPVIIAGAGIAGLTAAIALARAGARVMLIERRPGFSEVGAGLQLTPNATSVLRSLDLLGVVGRHAVTPGRLAIRRWGDARPHAGMTMQDEPEADASPFWSLRRSDLQTALLDAVRMQPGVKLAVGRTVTAIERSGSLSIVTVETERGASERIEASAVIGADGLWSGVRRLSGFVASPRFLGYEAWRTLLPAKSVETFARQPAVNLWLGREGHAVHYPVARGDEVNLVLIRKGRDASQEWSRPGDGSELSAMAASAAPTLKALISGAPSWQVWSLFDAEPAPMANGLVALIGDAAHPVLPFLAQGAALAIEDAGVLASLLGPALAQGGVEAALARFAGVRAARVKQVQERARRNGRIYHAGFPVAAARDLYLSRIGDSGMRRSQEWLYGWRMG